MGIARESQRFPTRNYLYQAENHERDATAPDTITTSFSASNTLLRFVLGLDLAPTPMTEAEQVLLEDPFGKLLRKGGVFPLTLREVLGAINGLNAPLEALPDELIFLVADGGHIPWTPETKDLQRAFRFAVARGNADFRLLISSSTNTDSALEEDFLQIIGWDKVHEVFHYYQRRDSTWIWAGMSPHALEEPTRGQGPFDSHVNGSLVMKELRTPWIHWHAPQAGINADSLAPEDPLRNNPLFIHRATAERLEREVVRPGIRRWNRARARHAVGDDGAWKRVPTFLRQVITDTTVNLTTTAVASRVLTNETKLLLPLTFFLNQDTFFETLALTPEDLEAGEILISGKHYRDCLARYDVHRTDSNLRVEGDVNFAFLTPEPAFEDTDLLDALIQAQLLSPRFAACLTMTDFSNPIFSSRRTTLLRYVPETVLPLQGTLSASLETSFVELIQKAEREEDSPETEFLALWDIADWQTVFVERITRYLSTLKVAAQDADIVDGWFRLAESRRRLFRRRKLAEFRLTTPQTNIPEDAPMLRMRLDGRVEHF